MFLSNEVYLFNAFDYDDVTTTLVFVEKKKALEHIAKNYFHFNLKGENKEEDIMFWEKNEGEGLTLEKVRLMK